MPSGYTSELYNGKDQTFPEFAMNCARAFGALVELRDDPDAGIPGEFQPSPAYARRLAAATGRLETVQSWTPALAEREAESAYLKETAARLEDQLRREALRKRYEAMLQQVQAWVPPTSEHEGLKDFMAGQLTEAAKFDCAYHWPAPRRLTAREYREQEEKDAAARVTSCARELQDEIARARGRSAWVRALRESLDA